MAKVHSSETKKTAIFLREKGYSLQEISHRLKIAKSTASIWLRNIKLSKSAQKILNQKKALARQKAAKSIRKKHLLRKIQIESQAQKTISNLDLTSSPFCKIVCSLLFWGEGGKNDHYVSFINSDPEMIAIFLKTFRKSFPLQESKFRALIHIHEYHNEKKLKQYWSNLTKIPLNQFTKSYRKPHTGSRKKEGYKGAIKIKYYDSSIAMQLKAIYNQLAKTI